MSDPNAEIPGSAGRRAEGTRTVPVYEPLTDIYETDAALVLTLEMPGVDIGGLSVSLEKRVLSITGQGSGAAPEGHALVHREYRVGDYERAFTIPDVVDSEKIAATLHDGVLTLTLPKGRPAPAKKIDVNAV